MFVDPDGRYYWWVGRLIPPTIKLAKYCYRTLRGRPDKGLGNNPFKGKNADQIDELFKERGFRPRGPNPKNGKGDYLNPRTGRQYHNDANHRPPKIPHVSVRSPKGTPNAVRNRGNPRVYQTR